MPKSHHVTNLIFEESHVKGLHCTPRALLTLVREQFWLIARRNTTYCKTIHYLFSPSDHNVICAMMNFTKVVEILFNIHKTITNVKTCKEVTRSKFARSIFLNLQMTPMAFLCIVKTFNEKIDAPYKRIP